MKIIKAQKIPQRKVNPEDTLARFCYFYPQYTFYQARKLPLRRIIQMLKVARRIEAQKMFELAQIIAAPHSNKGKDVKKVLNYYQSIMEGRNE